MTAPGNEELGALLACAISSVGCPLNRGAAEKGEKGEAFLLVNFRVASVRGHKNADEPKLAQVVRCGEWSRPRSLSPGYEDDSEAAPMGGETKRKKKNQS